MKRLSIFILFILAAVPLASVAETSPRALTTDPRVRQVMYNPNQVYHIVGTARYQTTIEFGDESIKVVSLGDTVSWQTVPYQNRLFLKPVEADAETNMTVITDKRTYYFRLTSTTRPSSDTVFLVRFHFQDALPTFSSEPRKEPLADFNLDYEVAGTPKGKEAIRLLRAFDDGTFTYFEFADKTEIPSIYLVGADGTESLVNKRREGRYMVVERLGNRYTIRNGDLFICVRNNAGIREYETAIKAANGE